MPWACASLSVIGNNRGCSTASPKSASDSYHRLFFLSPWVFVVKRPATLILDVVMASLWGRHIFHFYYIRAVYQLPAARQPQAEDTTHEGACFRWWLPEVAKKLWLWFFWWFFNKPKRAFRKPAYIHLTRDAFLSNRPLPLQCSRIPTIPTESSSRVTETQ